MGFRDHLDRNPAVHGQLYQNEQVCILQGRKIQCPGENATRKREEPCPLSRIQLDAATT